MKTINHEGSEYVLRSDVENIIKDRVSKVASRANDSDIKIKDLEGLLREQSSKISTVDLLTQQVEELQGNLKGATKKYQRHVTISKHGLSDPEMIEAIEWSFEKSQSKLAKKDRVELGAWLESQISNPEQASPLLRPHLANLGNQSQPTPQEQPRNGQNGQPQPTQPPQAYPSTNRGAIPAPETPDMLSRAMSDPEFYRANREKIQELWRSKSRSALNGQ